MGLFTYLSKVAAMVDSAAENRVFLTRHKSAGKPSGLGNSTTPPTHIKPKKKAYGTKKLSKKQRKIQHYGTRR